MRVGVSENKPRVMFIWNHWSLYRMGIHVSDECGRVLSSELDQVEP